VTAQAAVLKSLQIDTSLGAKVSLGGQSFIFINALDENSLPLSGLAISVRSLDPDIVQVYNFGLVALQAGTIGQARIVASTTSYGVTKADTVLYSVQFATNSFVYLFEQMPGQGVVASPSVVALGVGGSINWSNSSSGTLAITFDNNKENVQGGDIAAIPPFSGSSRTFTAAGTYNYHITPGGATGQVIVHEQPQY
jgi:plastocyanin